MRRFLELFLWFIFLSLTGCGIKNRSITPTFQQQYDKFVGDASAHGVSIDQDKSDNLVIMFDNLEMNAGNGNIVIGLCETGFIGVHDSPEYRVRIDTQFWNDANDYDRESLLYHELGHCLLGRRHRMDMGNDGEPVSLMYPVLVESEVFNASNIIYNNYIAELFTHLNSGTTGSQGCVTTRRVK